MVKQESRNVNTTNKQDTEEEIMIPYNRVLLIAWDKDAGVRLKKIRENKGLSQQGLIDIVGAKVVSLDTLQSLEQGRLKSVSSQKLNALLEILDSDARCLFPSVTVKNF